MTDDFHKGTLNDSSNVSNHSEFYRGHAYQDAANAPRTTGSPHGNSAPMFASGGGMVITGESPILQTIVSVPFVIVGALLYPIPAVLSAVTALVCTRFVPLFGPTAGSYRFLAYLPVLVVFWFSMRWDQRFADRHTGYRRARHVARIFVFAAIGFVIAGRFFPVSGAREGQLLTTPHIVGALAGAALGHWFLLRGDGWRDFWYRTLAKFRLRPAL